jgi:hypothetical protein
MAALLAERPRTGPTRQVSARTEDDDTGRRRRFRRGEEPEARGEPQSALPDPAPTVAPPARSLAGPPAPTVTVDAPPPVPEPASGYSSVLGYHDEDYYGYDEDDDGPAEIESPSIRRRLIVVGLPLLALALIIGLAVWFGTNVLSVAGSVDSVGGSTPSASATTPSAAPSSSASASAAQGAPVAVTGAEVFDPYGDGAPENARRVKASYDGDPGTSWATLEYRGSAHFGNLKPGVGVVYDLGGSHQLTGVTIATDQPGATVEVRTAQDQGSKLDDYAPAGTATLDATTKVSFAKPAQGRYVLVWITGLVPSPKGFSADLAEFSAQAAG